MPRRSLLAWRLALPALLVALTLGACSDDPAGEDTTTDTSEDTTQPDPWAVPDETDDWRILFNYRGRLSDNQSMNDLWLMDAQANALFAVTELTLKDLDPPLSCNFGCIVSPDLQWIAVVVGPPSATGFEIKIGRFNDKLEVSILKGLTLTDIVDFKFAGDRIFYSKQKACTGATCQYDFYIVDLTQGLVGTPFLVFPPDSETEDSVYKGNFRVASDGTSMVMLNPTIRSVGVWLWKDGTGLIELDYICKFGTKNDCSGTGSEYSDLDPVAIDPTGRWIVFFTFSDKWQRARIYDTQNPDSIQLSILASVPAGSYIEHACDAGVLASWQWERVLGQPVFTPDSSEIVFRSETTCTADGRPATKPLTNIRRVKLDTLLSGKTIEESDIYNVTNNPEGDLTANRRVTGFRVTPDGATIVMTATPDTTTSGTPIGDGQARQRNDREVYRLKLDGTGIRQLTNDLSFAAESPFVVDGQ